MFLANHTTNKAHIMIESLAILLQIRKVLGSNLGPEMAYHEKCFSVVFLILSWQCRYLIFIRPRQLPFMRSYIVRASDNDVKQTTYK
jgi:hypothetical protein